MAGAPAYHTLFEEASSRGIPSVGIGDGGNEIGFGVIFDAVREIQPYGTRCLCPCEDGIATVVPANALVVAGVSNWGAYAVAAMVSILSGRPDAFHDAETERRAILACYDAGAVDGSYANHGFTVDGIDAEVSVEMVFMLGEMIRLSTLAMERPF
jgi:hypothetical protein